MKYGVTDVRIRVRILLATLLTEVPMPHADSPTEGVDTSLRSDRSWFAQCGSCGGNGWVKNAAVVRDKTCERCATFGSDGDLTTVVGSLVTTELGWCGCGTPEEVDRMMRSYLAAVRARRTSTPVGVNMDAALLLAYIADDLGWTEHGGSIGGAWLTPDGEAALANLSSASGGSRSLPKETR